MPIRQNILRKGKAPKQNLLSFDVLQEESGVLGDLTTSRFFKISEFPPVLPSGNSSFLIEGSNLLKPEVELKTELLDAQGNPIFHYAIPNYEKELPARRIAVEVYDDEVVNGVGSFTILGELNPREFDIPGEFKDTYNVRFTAPVSINREVKNIQPIRFYGDPTLSVSELVKGVIEKAPTGGSTDVSITGSVEFINSNPQVQFSVDSGSTTGNSNQFEEVGNSVASYINQNQGSAQSSILPPTIIPKKQFSFVVKEMEKGVDNALNKITSGMKGASFSITRPDLLVDSTTFPDSKFDKPQSFETKILDVINSSTFTTTTDYTITNKKNNNKLIVPFGASSSNATITHNVISSTETEDQVFKRSFANMTVGNLRTFSGDTYKAKIYMKEEGSSGEFEPIYETLVESPNELVNPNSISGFQNIGLFFTQSIIDNNWTTSSAQAPATQNDDTIIDGVLLSGSNAELGSSFTFVTKNTLSLEKNEDYIVEFNAAYLTAPKAQSDGTTKTLAELEVFITGSFETENQSEISLGRVETTRGSLGGRFLPLKRQITDFKTHNGNSSPSGSLGFRVNSGQFKLSDIRLRPFSQTNFSPGFFKANVPMPKPIKRGKLYDFMVEFYDANNNLAETVALVDNVSFQGPPQVIADGADGLLTGSLFISDVTGSGIELHGGSAYMRSIGYNGFDRTIGENLGGFLIFSGSVSESMGTSQSYEGVGLEIVDAHGDTDRFLKFRTNPSEFTVQTDQFFLGKAGQFISGSNGNIVISSSNFFLGGESTFVSGSNDKLEISSSNFHLDDDGSVTMQGTITAEAGGTIGGFTIGASSLAAGNVFQLSSSQDIEDPASMISSSKFKVSAGGQLTGSSVLLTGGTITGATTITSDVTIQGSVSANSILVPATIAGSPATIANASASIDDKGNAVFRSGSIGGFNMDGTTLFSDSAEFVVTGSTGQITGSQVLFTGGKIGGFDMDAISIASSNGNLIMSSSGQITASSADLTGDLNATHIKADSGSIGGFDLSSTTFNSTDGNISLNSSQKAFRISNATFGNTGIQLEHNSGTPRAHIGKSDGEGFKFDGTNVVMSSSAFLLGSRAGGNSFVSGSNGGIEISGSAFHLLNGTITASNVDLSGKITADSGEIGGFSITENAISSSNNELILRGAGTGTSAGQITGSRVLFSGGEIGGFLITSDTIETKDFVSGLKGVRLSTSNNGSLEVEEARIRGTLKTTVFEKETVNAVGGQLIVANSTAITGSDVAKTDTTMSVENVTGFAPDEILLIKKVSGSNFSTEYVQVISSSNDFNSDTNFQGKLMVSRSFGSSATYNPTLHSGSITTTTATGSTYTTGQVLVSTGKIDTGFIKLNANPNDSATPFIDIVERTGSGVFDVDLKARLGDLSGLSSGLVGSSPGFGLFSENVFLTGKITATSGEIGGLTIGSDKVHVGTGTHGNSNTAFYVDDSGKFSLKDKLVWDGTDLNIDGTLSIGSLPAGTVSGSAQLAADISGAADTAGISASAAAGQSGSLAFDTHATQVVLSSAGMDVKNTSAQTIASFGASAKLFGGANNTADFAEVNGDGLTIVANSETASIMNNGGTAIMGGTATASLNSSGLTLISGGQTGSLVSANGVAIYGASDKNERLDVNADGLTLIANNITGSSFTATTSSVFGSSDKHERVEVVGTGFKIYENNKQMVDIGSSGLEVFDTSNNQVASFGSDTTLTGGTITIRSSDNNNDKLVITEDSLVISDNNNAVASFGANTILEGGTVTIRNTTNNNDKVVLSENKLEVFDNNNVVAEFGANTVIEGGTITLRNTTNNNDKVVLSQDKLQVFDNNTDVASFGAITRLGAVANNHMSMSSDGLSIKTAADVTVLSASADGITMSGSIKAGAGEIGGMTIDEDSIFTGTKDTAGFASNNGDLTVGTSGIHSKVFFVNTSDGSAGFAGTVTIGGTDLDAANTLNTNTDLGDVGLSLADISGSISGSYLNAGSSSMASRVKIESTGISVDNASGTSLASLTNSLRVGVVGDNKSRLEIDSDGNLEIINRQGSTDTTVISLDKDGDATFAGALSAATGTFSGQLVIGGSNTSLTTADLAASLATEISGSSLSGSNSATATGEASVSASTSATATGEQGIADAATAQAAVDTIEGKVVIGGSSVSVQQNSSNKAVLTTSGVELFQGGTSVSNFGSTVRVGPDANSKSRVEIDSGAVKIINKDGSGNETTMLNFKSDGDIESGDFLIERSRLFGAGGDGGVKLLHNSASYSISGSGLAQGDEGMPNTSQIKDERGDIICQRTGSVWEMKGDCYFKELEVDGATATTLITSGSRLFVQGTLTIDSGCVIHNDGGDGDTGANASTSDNSTSGYGDGGANSPTKPGSGGPGKSLAAGGDGAPGSRGGNPDTAGGGTVYGGNGGAGGGNGGIVMIAARTIVNNGTIRSHGGDGGDGGRGSSGAPGSGGTAAAAGDAGSAGSIVHVKI